VAAGQANNEPNVARKTAIARGPSTKNGTTLLPILNTMGFALIKSTSGFFAH
jgi:hypothetical protein